MTTAIAIDSDDAELGALIRRLERLVTDAGGYLSTQLQVRSRGGELSVGTGAAEGDLLVRLPASCLVAIDGVDIALRDDQLLVTAYPPAMSEAQRGMLDCMFAIFNRGQKVRQYRAELPWLAFMGVPALLDSLHAARADAPKPTQLHDWSKSGDSDRLAREGFLGSRTLKYQTADGDMRRVVMPFIDFFNHHAASPPFGRDQDAITVTASRPLAGSNECFVRYNVLDAMDTYLNYGFADATAPFVRSVPVRVELPGVGVLHIRARVAPARKHPPAAGLQDLGSMLPRCQRLEDGGLAAAQLLIPTTAPELFYRTLGALIQQLAPGLAQADLRRAVDAAVAQTLAANRDYYRSLGELAESHAGAFGGVPAHDRLRLLVDLQRNKLATIESALARDWDWDAALPSFPYNFGHGLGWS